MGAYKRERFLIIFSKRQHVHRLVENCLNGCCAYHEFYIIYCTTC